MIKVDPDQEEDRSYSPDIGHARKKSKLFVNEDNVDDQSLPESDDEQRSRPSTSRYLFIILPKLNKKFV